MKKSFIFATLAALLLFTSCGKEGIEPSASHAKKVSLEVTVDMHESAVTRATGAVNTNATNNQSDSEKKINNLQVFVFNGDVRDGYVIANASGSASVSSASVECTAGTRDVYCIANAPSALGTIVSKTELLATMSSLSNGSAGFEMIGFKAGQTITDGASVSVPVSRIASKIVIQAIKNSLRTGQDLQVTRVYITNVAGQFNYGLSEYAGASSTWYNKGGYRAAAADNLGNYTQDVGLSANVAGGASYSTNHYFYAYPNNNAQTDYTAAWAPRRTMLVVQIKVADKLYDYPIDLGVDLEADKMYVIKSLELKNLGNPDDGAEGGADEENPVEGSTVSVTIDVEDWTVVNLGDGGNISV